MPDEMEPVPKKRKWLASIQKLRFRKTLVSVQKQKPGSEPNLPLSRKKRIKRPSIKGVIQKSLKYSFLISTGFFSILVICYNVARLVYDDADIKAAIESTAHHQTGGKLSIGEFKFRFLRGFKMSNIEFYPTTDIDKESKPLAKIDQVEVSYSLPKILIGRFHIAALKLTRPSLYIHQTDQTFNFSSILDYRKKKFPLPDTQQPQEPEKQTTSDSDATIPINLAFLYMPFEIIIHDIGIKNLELIFIKSDHGNIIQKVALKGASLDLGAFWHKSKSTLSMSILSCFEDPLQLTVEGPDSHDKPGSNDTHKAASVSPSALKTLIEIKSAQVINLTLEDFQSLKLDVASRFPKLQIANISQNNASIYLKTRIKAIDDFRRISIETIETQILDALTYMLKGELSVPLPKMEKMSVNLAQSASVDLSKVSQIIAPFVKGLEAEGIIRIEKLLINGELDLLKLQDPTKAEGLPALSGVVWIDQVKASIANSGISMDPISGRISLLSTPKATQNGIQADLSLDLNIPRISLAQVQDKIGPIETGVKKLNIKLLTRLVWPDAVVPIIKLNIEAQNVVASGAKIGSIDVPLFLNVNGEGDKDLSQLSLVQNFQLGNLAEISAMADCQLSCSRFRANIMARLESLNRLYSILIPAKGTILPEEYAPSNLQGNIDLQFNAKGQIPNPLKTDLAAILKEGDITFNLQTTVAKLTASIPFMSLYIQSFENRILAKGDLKEQNIEIAQKFDSLKLNLPSKKDSGKPIPQAMKIEANRYSFDIALKNNFSSTIDLKNPLANMATNLETWLYIGQLDIPGILPKQLSELSFDSAVSQSKLKSFNIDNIAIKIPDYGTTLKLNAHTEVAEDFVPTEFKTNLSSQINHNGNENLPGSIKTVGRLETKMSLSSPNMKELDIDGSIGFEKFSLYLLDPINNETKTVSIEDITGEMPLKQTIKIPYIRDLLKSKTKSEEIAETPGPKKDEITDEKLVKNIAINEKLPSDLSMNNLTDSIANFTEKTRDKLAENTNTVTLVDYSSIRPFFPKKRPISIRRVDVANLELSNLEFDVEVKQNWFALNQYLISFLGGKIQGGFLLAFDANFPNSETILDDIKKVPKSLRTSVHVTRLDTRKLIERFPNLKGKGDSLIPVFSNPYLDGTVHLSYDMLTSEMGGGIEITSIGKEQLKMILYYVDPFEQNPTISDIRSALDLGEVRQVSIPLKNGEIGMAVDVRVLGAPLPTPKLTRFPLSQIIKNFIDQGPSSEKKSQDPTAGQKSARLNPKQEESTKWYLN